MYGQRPPSITGAIHTLRKDGMRVILWRNHDIVSLAGTKAELIDTNRLYVLTVGLNDRHFQTRNTDIIKCITGAINESQPDPLTGLEQSRPVARRRCAIHQIS